MSIFLGEHHLFTKYQPYTIYALGGNDTVRGTVLSNTIYGGSGDDYLNGYSSLTLYPKPWGWPDQPRGDTLYGESGNDTLIGNESSDSLYGGTGNDKLFGYEGGDFLSGGEGDDLYTVTTSDNARYSDAGPDHIDEQLGGGNDTIKFTDLDRSEISLNVDIDNSDTDLWLSSSEDLEDGQNDSGVIIEDFFVIKDGSYAFNNDNVIENVATADNYTVDLTDIDLDAINAAYEASQASAATIA